MEKKWNSPSPSDVKRYPPEIVFEAGVRNHHISNTAYPIAHNVTWKPYRMARDKYDGLVTAAWDGIYDLCLYTHIPFCETRCSYCEYTVVGKNELSQTEEYMSLLNCELELYQNLLSAKERTLHGFDIGGGTPSFVNAELIEEHVARVRAAFQFAPGVRVSIETTPKIAADEPHKLKIYKRAGIERISMGVQVIQPDLLKILNRSGNGAELHRRAVDNIRGAGFKLFNIDLMYGFAGQSSESWRATLEHVVALQPEYITLYRMRYKLTRISHQAPFVSLDDVRAQSAVSRKLLSDAGYCANPGKNTFSKIHGDTGTSDYLRRRVVDGMPYLGIGLGAQSFTHTAISYNDGAVGKNILPYRRSIETGKLPVQDLYDLPQTQMMAKMVAVSFYFGEINARAFEEKFGVTLEEAFPAEVAYVLERGLMNAQGETLSLTHEGAKHFNGVIALFFAPSVQKYLIERDPDKAGDMRRARGLALAVAGER